MRPINNSIAWHDVQSDGIEPRVTDRIIHIALIGVEA